MPRSGFFRSKVWLLLSAVVVALVFAFVGYHLHLSSYASPAPGYASEAVAEAEGDYSGELPLTQVVDAELVVEKVEEEIDPDPYGYLAALEITQEELAELPRPVINTILPAGLPTIEPADLLPLAAIPINELTPGFINPGDAEPVLALEEYSDLVVEPILARWTVVGQQNGWVKVIVPVGRGALPSQDAAAVNHQAVWVPEGAVTLEEETHRIEVSIGDRLLTVFDGDEEVASFHVGVGIIGRTDTPLGLCSVIARVVIQTGAQSLLTSCQSEDLDGFAGVNWATVAVHEGSGFDRNTGGAVSNGCVRVPPAQFKAYLDEIRTGTPVVIVE